MPSVLNAIAAATGKPVRSLPLKNVKLETAQARRARGCKSGDGGVTWSEEQERA